MAVISKQWGFHSDLHGGSASSYLTYDDVTWDIHSVRIVNESQLYYIYRVTDRGGRVVSGEVPPNSAPFEYTWPTNRRPNFDDWNATAGLDWSRPPAQWA